MPVSAKQIIDQIEPYQGGHGEALWFLHTLDIADKHVVLVSVSTNIAKTVQLQMTPELTEFSVLFSAPGLKEGAVLGEVSGNSEANQRINFTFDIAFGQSGRFEGEPVVETLTKLSDFVERIVNYFAGLF